MDKNYPDPGDPNIVAKILEHQKSLTREQWLERLARVPGIVAEHPPVAEELNKGKAASPIVVGSVVTEAVSLAKTSRGRRRKIPV